jgi:hypothetical protein
MTAGESVDGIVNALDEKGVIYVINAVYNSLVISRPCHVEVATVTGNHPDCVLSRGRQLQWSNAFECYAIFPQEPLSKRPR